MGLKLQSTKKLSNNSEEGYKIQLVRCSFFKQKIDVKAEREETLTHKVTQQRRHRGKNLEKAILEGFLGQRGLALYFQRQGELYRSVQSYGGEMALC